MILKILLLIFIFIVITLLVLFLAHIFSPAVQEQTKIEKDILLSKIEYKFDKLDKKEPVIPVEKKAQVLCSCNKTFSSQPEVKSIRGQSCAVIYSLYKSLNDCVFSCIGLGDCIKNCIQEAIFIKNGTAVISNLCNGCGNCVNSCPKNLIALVPVSNTEEKRCANRTQFLTSCSNFEKLEKNHFEEKKGFKIWQFCYKLLHK